MSEVALLYEYLSKLELIGSRFVRLNNMIRFKGDSNSIMRFFVLINLDGEETAVENSHYYLCKLVR